MTADQARRAARQVGVITGVIGAALTTRPDEVGKLGRLDDLTGLRTIGMADLALVPGLLVGRPRRPWMVARAVLNLMIAAFLLSRPANADTTKRRVIAVALSLLTVQDARVARALDDEA